MWVCKHTLYRCMNCCLQVCILSDGALNISFLFHSISHNLIHILSSWDNLFHSLHTYSCLILHNNICDLPWPHFWCVENWDSSISQWQYQIEATLSESFAIGNVDGMILLYNLTLLLLGYPYFLLFLYFVYFLHIWF